MNWRVLYRMTLNNIGQTFEYRGAFLIMMVNTVIGPVIALLVWLTASEQGVALPYTHEQFVTYFVLLSLVGMLTAAWNAEFVAEGIRLGGLSPWLIRPTSYLVVFAANNLGEKIVKLPLLLPVIALAVVGFRSAFRLPSDPLIWLLFAISLPFAAAVAFLIDFVIGSLAFWIEDAANLVPLKILLGSFLAGGVVPLALFPPRFAALLELQPFRYTLSFPLELLMGRLSPAEITRGMALQIGYCVVLWLVYRIMWRYGLRTYSATGA